MLAGILELQIMAGIAQLSTDLKRAEEQVKTSTDKMGRNVATLESAFGKLGSTLSLGLAFEAVRRLTDDYTKLTAQIRIATHSQAEYAQGLAEIRRISTESQASITATGALYTRLSNSLGAFGATQKQVANITETVSLGLKAYGATSVEAASAMLQLSQAFASNRLGGDEFRAMMESMPNMMRTLAKSMRVPFEALKVLSAEGKITTKEMMKAWDDPALIAALQKQANMTRTITGEIAVFRNNITMLVGEFMGASKGTSGITSALRLMSDAVLVLSKHIEELAAGATIAAALFAGRWLLAVAAAKKMTYDHGVALAMNARINLDAAEAERVALTVKVATAEAESRSLQGVIANTAATIKLTQATLQAAFAKNDLTIASLESLKAQFAHAQAAGVLSGHLYQQRVVEAELAAATATRTSLLARLVAMEEAQAITSRAVTVAMIEEAMAMNLLFNNTAKVATATEALAVAQIGSLAKVANFAKNLVGGTLGVIGLALWGAYEIADHLGWIDKVFNRAKYNMDMLKGLAGDSPIFAKAFAYMEGEMAKYEANLKRVAAMKDLGVTVSVNATPTEMINAIDKALKDLDHAIIWGQTNRLEAAMQLKLLRKGLEEPIPPALSVTAKQIDHDLLFVTKRYDELLAKFEKGDIVQWQLTEGIKKMYEELSPKAEKASSEVNSWNKRLEEQAAAIAGVAEEGRKLTKSETEYNDLVIALNSHKDKQLANMGEEYMRRAQLNIAGEAANIATAEAVKLAEKQAETLRQINAHGITQIDTLDKEIAAQKLHNDSIGKSAEQIANLKTEAEALLIVKMENEARDLSSAATSDAVAATKLANIQAEIAKMKELRDLKAGAAPLEAAKKLADEEKKAQEKKAQEKLWHDIDRFAHTAFDNIFDKGKNVFEELGKVIKKSILDMLYQMTIKEWIFKIGATSVGVGASGLAGAADMGNAGSLFSAGSNAYSTLGGMFASGAGGMSGMAGNTAIMSAAYTAPAIATAAGEAASAGAASGAMSAISTAMPYLAAAYVAYSLLTQDHGTPTRNLGNATAYFDPSGNQTQRYTYYGGSSPEIDARISTMQTSYMQAAMALGIGTVTTGFGYGANTGKDSQNPNFSTYGTAGGVKFSTGGETPYSDAAAQLAASRAVFAALQGSQLPKYLTGVFDGLSAGAMSQAQINDTLAYAQSLKTMREALLETRTPLDITKAQIADATKLLGTSAKTYKLDFVAAIDKGINPQVFTQWQALGTAIDTVAKATLPLTLNLASATDYFSSQLEYDRLIGRIGGGSVKAPATNDDLIAELKALREEVARLTDASNATAKNTKQTADTLRNVSQDGTAFTTVPA